MSMKGINTIILIVFAGIVFTACKKDAGEGGNSSITGYVHETNYNASYTFVQGDYDAADEDIYIIYGDDISIGDRTRTSPDGRFEFKFLRKGKYRLYVYTGDTTVTDTIGKVAVIKDVEITKKKQTVDCGTFEIKSNN